MRFHFKDGGLTIPNVNDACIFTRALNDTGAGRGEFFRWMREDLYEQCSDHITEKIPSSV